MLPLLAGIAGAVTELGKFGYGIYQDQRDSAYQRELNEQNMAFQQAQFDYQKEINERNFEWQKNLAENQYQIKAADMQKAGLNPVLAAGGAGISQAPVSSNTVSAPSTQGYRSKDLQSAGFGGVFQSAMLGLQAKRLENENKLLNAQYEDLMASARQKDASASSLTESTRRENTLFNGRMDSLALENTLKGIDIDQAPTRFQGLLLDNLVKQGTLSLQQKDVLLKAQDLVNKKLDELLSQQDYAESTQRISKAQLENAVLAHNTDIILSRDALPNGHQSDEWVAKVFPGLSRATRDKISAAVDVAKGVVDTAAKLVKALK